MQCGVVTGASLAFAALCAACVMPIPNGSGLEAVVVFAGEPARPRPMLPKHVIAHPLLGQQSGFHDDHYNSDVTDYRAPLGLLSGDRRAPFCDVFGTPS